MNGFKLTPTAVEDLKEISRYTQSKWGRDKRNLYLNSLDNKFAWLAKNPEIGKPRDDIKDGYFSYPEGKHNVFYRIKQNHIEIIGIIHQSMDAKLHL